MTRVPYETKGGTVSEDDQIMIMIEKLREASEAAYQIGHINNAAARTMRGEGFRRMGEKLEEMAKLALTFATQSTTRIQ
jgi:hypothetical protein